MEGPDEKVKAVPVRGQESGAETIVVAVGPRAYGAVGPPSIGYCFSVKTAETSDGGELCNAAHGTVIWSHAQPATVT
eukprot:6854161-Pyramimonas_sp.AAC.1